MAGSRTTTSSWSSRAFWAALLGSLLLQLAYTSVVPAFRGADEFDHVYKADSVAHGQPYGTVDTRAGRGELLSVSPDLQEAAERWCRWYDYTAPDDCRVVARTDDDMVEVSSGVSSYNPAYYAVVGSVARPFAGETALWVMRAVTIAWCSLLVAAAAALGTGRVRGTWPGAALVLCLTPTVMYSGAVVAPNGVGYCAALLWWVASVRLARDPDRTVWVLWGLAGVTLVACHSTNPLWLPLMGLAVLGLRPLAHWRRATTVTRAAPVALGAVVVSTVACLAWAVLVGTHAGPEGPTGDSPRFSVAALLGNEVAWHLQVVAAFPLRNDPLPAPVYLAWIVPLLALLVLGARAADRRTRSAMGVLVAGWVVVPLVLTALTFQGMAFAWQGRYAIPLVLGLPVLAAASMAATDRRLPGPAGCALVIATALAHMTCLAHVGLTERTRDLSTQLSDFPGGWAVAAVLGGAGALVLGAAAVRRPPAATARPG